MNMGLIEDTEIGRLILHIMLAFAEFERDLIVSRTQGGRAHRDHAMDLLRGHSFTDVARMTGISRSTVVREAKTRGIRKSALS